MNNYFNSKQVSDGLAIYHACYKENKELGIVKAEKVDSQQYDHDTIYDTWHLTFENGDVVNMQVEKWLSWGELELCSSWVEDEYVKIGSEPEVEEEIIKKNPINISERIKQLSELKDGWLNGDGKGFNKDALAWLEICFANFYYSSLPLPYLFPTVEGIVEAEWVIGDWDICLEINLETKVGELHLNNKDGSVLDIHDMLLYVPAAWNNLNIYIKNCGDEMKKEKRCNLEDRCTIEVYRAEPDKKKLVVEEETYEEGFSVISERYTQLTGKKLDLERLPVSQETVFDVIEDIFTVQTYKSIKYQNKILDKSTELLEEMMDIKFDRIKESNRLDDKLDLLGYFLLYFAKMKRMEDPKYLQMLENALKD